MCYGKEENAAGRHADTEPAKAPSAAVNWDRESVLQRMFRWGQIVMETFSRFAFKQASLGADESSAGVGGSARAGERIHAAMLQAAKEISSGSQTLQGIDEDFLQNANAGSSDKDICFRQTMADVKQQLETQTISTAFSGVDAPGASLLCLGLGVCEVLQIQCDDALPQAEHTYAIEFYSRSQEELAIHPHKPSCIFSDMLSFLEPELPARLPALAEKGVLQEVLVPLIKSGKAVRADAPCLVHGRRCRAKISDIHCAGTPCTDYSPKGLREAEGGKTYAAFLTWAGQRLLAQESVIIQENVQQFPLEQLQLVLGQLYFIESIVLSPRSLGWPVERKRRWTVLRHRYKTKAFQSPLSYFASMFRLPTCWGAWTADVQEHLPAWDVFFAGSVDELEHELRWATSRAESMFHRMNVLDDGDDGAKRSDGLTGRLLDIPNVFYTALNGMEQQHLQDMQRVA